MGQRRITVSEVTKVQGEIFFNVSVNTACKQIYFSLRKQNNVFTSSPWACQPPSWPQMLRFFHLGRGRAVSSEAVAILSDSWDSRLAAWGPSTLENTRAATVAQLTSPPHTFSVSFIHLTHSWNSFRSLSTEFTIEIKVWCMVISYRLWNFTCNLVVVIPISEHFHRHPSQVWKLNKSITMYFGYIL